MNEVWKDIKGYEGSYQVSSIGRVRSLDRIITHMNMGVIRKHLFKGKILKPLLEHDGYLYLFLYKKGSYRKKFSIHRLVCETFISNPNNYPIINHKDEDKTNNAVENLEWCDYSYNNTYNNKHIKIGLKRRGWKPTNEMRLKMSIAAKNRKKKGI